MFRQKSCLCFLFRFLFWKRSIIHLQNILIRFIFVLAIWIICKQGFFIRHIFLNEMYQITYALDVFLFVLFMFEKCGNKNRAGELEEIVLDSIAEQFDFKNYIRFNQLKNNKYLSIRLSTIFQFYLIFRWRNVVIRSKNVIVRYLYFKQIVFS